MKSNIKVIVFAITLFAMSVSFAGCDHSNRTTNGSADTTSSTKTGGPAIADTGTISAQEKQTKTDSVKKDTTAKGNVDPKGYSKKQ